MLIKLIEYLWSEYEKTNGFLYTAFAKLVPTCRAQALSCPCKYRRIVCTLDNIWSFYLLKLFPGVSRRERVECEKPRRLWNLYY